MSMLAYLLALAVGQPAISAPQADAATAVPAAERVMLDAFRAVCGRVQDYQATRAAAAAAGWQPIDPSANAQLAQIDRVSREAVGDEGRMLGEHYAQGIGGRTLYLTVSRWEGGTPETAGNGCRLYDFAAAAPIDLALLQSWMGRPPTGNKNFGPAGSNRLWEPGWSDGTTVSVNHVPAASPFRQRYGISGNVLVAQALGGN